jgi:transcriptional regulator with XRE-family HTH domain
VLADPEVYAATGGTGWAREAVDRAASSRRPARGRAEPHGLRGDVAGGTEPVPPWPLNAKKGCAWCYGPAWTGHPRSRGGSVTNCPAASYDCVMTEPDAVAGLPSPSSALLQLARLKAGMSQRELAERAGVPVTMISAYERDQRQPTLATLLRLLRAAGFDLRLHLAAYDPHDEILAGLEASRSEAERDRRDRQLRAWRDAVPADGAA